MKETSNKNNKSIKNNKNKIVAIVLLVIIACAAIFGGFNIYKAHVAKQKHIAEQNKIMSVCKANWERDWGRNFDFEGSVVNITVNEGTEAKDIKEIMKFVLSDENVSFIDYTQEVENSDKEKSNTIVEIDKDYINSEKFDEEVKLNPATVITVYLDGIDKPDDFINKIGIEDENISKLAKTVQKIEKNKNSHEEKIECLKTFIDYKDEINKNGYKGLDKENNSILIESLDNFIDDGRRDIKSYYDKTIIDNTLDKIEENKDKQVISTAKQNLEQILAEIKAEVDVVCTKDEIVKYEEKINKIIEPYTARITAIEEEEKKAAEEAAKQAEEESREQEKSASSNSGTNSNNYSSGSNGGSYSSSSGGSSNSGSSGSWHRYEMPDGSWTQYDHNNDGSWTAKDDQGNSWSSDDLSEWLD